MARRLLRSLVLRCRHMGTTHINLKNELDRGDKFDSQQPFDIDLGCLPSVTYQQKTCNFTQCI